MYRVSSDFRFAIDKAFREAGIEIPFHQTDVHLRDMDRLELALSGASASTACISNRRAPSTQNSRH